MHRFVLGVGIGFLSAASLAWAFTVQFPNTLKVRGSATVDESGNVLGGGTPVRVEIVDAASPPPSKVVVDANGTTVGTVSRVTTPGGQLYVTREVGGLLVEMSVRQLQIEGSAGGGALNLYFENPGCTGQAYAPAFPNTGSFYSTSKTPEDANLYFATGRSVPVNLQSQRTIQASGSGACSGAAESGNFYPVGTLDLTQFVPPFAVTDG